MKQRAFLAIALASDPAVLVADEPTTALDATVAAEVLDLLDRLREGRGLALLLISHDLGVVARHAERLLVLYAGKVVEEAETAGFFLAPRHPYSRALLASVPRLHPLAEPKRVPDASPVEPRFRAIPGTVPDLATRPRDACAFAPRCPDRFEPCDKRMPELYPVGPALARCFLYEPGK